MLQVGGATLRRPQRLHGRPLPSPGGLQTRREVPKIELRLCEVLGPRLTPRLCRRSENDPPARETGDELDRESARKPPLQADDSGSEVTRKHPESRQHL